MLNSLSINPTLVSPNFKNKAVFLFVPLDVCKTSGFTSTFSDAFKGICKVSFGSDLIPVKVVFVGLSRIISDTVIDDFCSIFGDVKDIKKDCHKNTKLAGDRVVASYSSFPKLVYETFKTSNTLEVGAHKITLRLNNKAHCSKCGLKGHGTNACWAKSKQEAADWVTLVKPRRFLFTSPNSGPVNESSEETEAPTPQSAPVAATAEINNSISTDSSVVSNAVDSSAHNSSSGSSTAAPVSSSAVSTVAAVTPSFSTSGEKPSSVSVPVTDKPKVTNLSANYDHKTSNRFNRRASTVGGSKSKSASTINPSTPTSIKSLFNSPSNSMKRKKGDDNSPSTTSNSAKNSSAKKHKGSSN